jgi:ubiquitin-protein ligase
MVMSWICGSICLEFFNIIMAPSSTIKQILEAIENLFGTCDSKKSRVIAKEILLPLAINRCQKFI